MINKVPFVLLLFSFQVLNAFDIKANVSVSLGRVNGNLTLSQIPLVEVDQALQEGFKAELRIILRLVRRNAQRFPWIDQIVEEQNINLTIWLDRRLRYYFVESNGQIVVIKSFNLLREQLAEHQFRFNRLILSNTSEYYLYYRGELRPIKLAEPFQFFLFYPFFTTYTTPWRSAELEINN